jgi:hypothetical protein
MQVCNSYSIKVYKMSDDDRKEEPKRVVMKKLIKLQCEWYNTYTGDLHSPKGKYHLKINSFISKNTVTPQSERCEQMRSLDFNW